MRKRNISQFGGSVVRPIKFIVQGVLFTDGHRVVDADGFTLPVTSAVAEELRDEMVRLGPFFEATLLFEEESYRAVDVVRTRSPSLFFRIYRFFWRRGWFV